MSTRTRTSVRQDCCCPRAEHRHGTRRAYLIDKCGCFECRVANARAMATYRRGGTNVESPNMDSTGTRRRLQALAAVGHGVDDIAALLGQSGEAISQLRRGTRTVRPHTAARIAAVYDQLWDQPPASRYARRVINNATRNGWVPPMAWDDDDIDIPDAQPNVSATDGPVDLQPCGTAAAARRHYRRGEPLDEACRAAARRQCTERSTAA